MEEPSVSSVWFRSLNVGSLRSDERKDMTLSGKFDIAAFQETCADVKDMHDISKILEGKQYKTQWSKATPAKGAGLGTAL